MEKYLVDKRTMSLVYDLTAQLPRKDLRKTDSWRIFWSSYPIKMATYQSLQKGNFWRILANHARVKGVICPHQVRLTIPVKDCVEAGTSFRFRVEEIRACACDHEGELSSNTLPLEVVIIFNILVANNDNSSEDEEVDVTQKQVGPEQGNSAALSREQRRKKLAEKIQKVQKANENAEVHDGKSSCSF